jgi:hypothetical protein
MTAYIEVQRNAGEPKRIMRVDGVGNLQHAVEILNRIRSVHADTARLLSLETEPLHCTVSEIMQERNLLGRREIK